MTKITFHNKPNLSGHEANKVFDERRVALSAQLQDFVATHTRFEHTDVGIIYAQKGVSSLITIIETADEKVVLKIPLSTGYSEGEALFLQTWEKAGVAVPHVYEEGTIGGHAYILMEYIDAPILMDAYSFDELVEKGLFREMGRTLRLMHTPEAKGYGRVVDGKAEYTNFKDWLFGPDMEKRIQYVEENALLGEECGSISAMRNLLLEHVQADAASSYCHDDFGGSNIFATKPLTVFDPNPRFNNGYIDLGRTMFNSIAMGIFPKQIIEGYFEGSMYNEKVLHAAIFLAGVMKFPYWHKVNKVEQIEETKGYFAQHKHLLA